jgi:SAM-dependent methyltransferase
MPYGVDFIQSGRVLMAFGDYFSQRSENYAAARPTYPVEVAEYVASIAPRRGLVWEAGCGSGQMSVLLATFFDHIAASDPSTAQLAHAARVAHVTYHCAQAEASALADGCADVAVAATAAHWFDRPAFYREALRVLKPDGVLAVIGYGNTQVDAEVDPVVFHFTRHVLKEWWPPGRVHVDSNYTTMDFPFAQLPAPSLEIQMEWTREQFMAYVDTWSAVRAMETAVGDSASVAFRAALSSVWDADSRKVVRWPLAIKAARVGGGR